MAAMRARFVVSRLKSSKYKTGKSSSGYHEKVTGIESYQKVTLRTL
jgi:hypothetical protein